MYELCIPKPSLIGLILDECGKHPTDPWAFGCECAANFAQCARQSQCVANRPLTECIASTCLPAQCGTDLVLSTSSTLTSSSTMPPIASSSSASTSTGASVSAGSTTTTTTSRTPVTSSDISSVTAPSSLSPGSASTSAGGGADADELPVGLWIGLGVAAGLCLIGFIVAALVWRQRRRRARDGAADDAAPPLDAVRTQRAASTAPKENSLYVPGSLTPSQVPNFTTNVSAVGTHAADSVRPRSTKRHRHRKRGGSSRSGSNSNRSDVDSGDVGGGDDDADNGVSAGYEAVPSLSASGRNKKQQGEGYDAVPPTVSSKNGGTKGGARGKHDAVSEGRLSSVMAPSSSGNGYDLIPSGAGDRGSGGGGGGGYDKLPGHGTRGHTYELVPEVGGTSSSIMLKRK
jgi:hypothetical protein